METVNKEKLERKAQEELDPESFAKLYEIHAPRIYRFIYFKVGSVTDAQDLTSDVFLRAWSYLRERKTEIRSFTALIFKIARNSVIDFYRARKSTVPLEFVDEQTFVSETPLETLSAATDLYTLLKAMKNLKEEYRDIIVLRYLNELSFQEISTVTGKSLLNTRVTLHRAVSALKKIIPRL